MSGVSDPNPAEAIEVAQAAGIISLGNVISRVLGLARETVKADLFGATGLVSAFEAAAVVPTILYDLLVGGMISSALVPVLSEYAAPERRAELWQLLSTLVSLTVVVLSALVLLAELAAPQLAWLMGSGFDAKLLAATTRMLRIVIPAILFLNLSGIISGVLYALKRFAAPAFTAAVFNATVVVVALLMGRRWGVDSLTVGLLVGAALQVGLQLPGLRDGRFRFSLNLNHPGLRRIGLLYAPIILGLVVDQFAVGLSYNLASHTGPPSISWMKYAATLIQFPLGLVVTAVSVAILPTLSRQAADCQSDSFQETLTRGLRLVLALIIPATVGLFVLARPVVALIFEHGDFTPADTVATAEALRYHLVGLIFAAVDQPLIFAFYARKDTLTPALVGVGTVVLYVFLALAPTIFAPLTLSGLILANSLKWMAHALLMLWLAQRRLGRLQGYGLGALVGKATLASMVMVGVVWLTMRGLTGIAPAGFEGELIVVGGAGIAGAAVYLGLAMGLGVEELGLLWRAVRARRKA